MTSSTATEHHQLPFLARFLSKHFPETNDPFIQRAMIPPGTKITRVARETTDDD